MRTYQRTSKNTWNHYPITKSLGEQIMNANDILKYGHNTVLEGLYGLTDDEWQIPGACGYWSVKDIMAHLASYEQLLVDIQQTFLGQTDTPTLDRYLADFEAINDKEVNQRSDYNTAEVWTEYEMAHQKTLQIIAQIPHEKRRLSGTLPWYGAEYDLEDLLVYMYYGHKREHSAQMAVFRDKVQSAVS
jgi:hypothetical protein